MGGKGSWCAGDQVPSCVYIWSCAHKVCVCVYGPRGSLHSRLVMAGMDGHDDFDLTGLWVLEQVSSSAVPVCRINSEQQQHQHTTRCDNALWCCVRKPTPTTSHEARDRRSCAPGRAAPLVPWRRTPETAHRAHLVNTLNLHNMHIPLPLPPQDSSSGIETLYSRIGLNCKCYSRSRLGYSSAQRSQTR